MEGPIKIELKDILRDILSNYRCCKCVATCTQKIVATEANFAHASITTHLV